jgi:hypothetical protein
LTPEFVPTAFPIYRAARLMPKPLGVMKVRRTTGGHFESMSKLAVRALADELRPEDTDSVESDPVRVRRDRESLAWDRAGLARSITKEGPSAWMTKNGRQRS